jgi:hypothetical protein
MITNLPKSLLAKHWQKLSVFIIALFTLSSSYAQPIIPGFTGIGTANGHYYYISNDVYFGVDISTAVTSAYNAIHVIEPGRPVNQVNAAAIVDAAENTFIQNGVLAYNIAHYGGNGKSTFDSWGDRKNVWIGLTDAAAEATFVWSNGQTCTTFRNWNVGEPNNYTGPISNGEDYVQMLIMNPYPYGGGTNDPLGKWNDWFNQNIIGSGGANLGPTKLPVIIEVGPTDCAPVCSLTVSASLAALSCDGPNVIYLGYGAQSVTATSNQVGTTFKWYMVGNAVAVSNTATLTPTQSGVYYVVGTNAGCTASTLGSAAQITVIDIRCDKDGKKPHKVYVCHKLNGTHGNGTIGDNAHTLCVDVDAVPAHLAHGDCLGECPNGNGRSPMPVIEEESNLAFSASVYPNPSKGAFTIQLTGNTSDKVSIRVTDMMGRVIEKRDNLQSNQVIKVGENYGTGLYFIEVSQGTERTQLKLVKASN